MEGHLQPKLQSLSQLAKGQTLSLQKVSMSSITSEALVHYISCSPTQASLFIVAEQRSNVVQDVLLAAAS